MSHLVLSLRVTGRGITRLHGMLRRPLGQKRPRGKHIPQRFLQADAISSVVSTMLMVAITVALSVLVWAMSVAIIGGMP